MKDQDFEKIMDTWADHETRSAPEMHPTAEMYCLVQAKTTRKPLSLVFSRPFVVATVVAGLLALTIVYTAFIRPSMRTDLPPGQAVALIGQREGFEADRGFIVKGTDVPPGKGPRRGPESFEQLMFQFQRQGSRFVEGIHLRVPQEETAALTSADNYRLVLEPAQDSTVYVFQLAPSDDLVKLFPNEVYSSDQNPLRRGQTYHLPAAPNWFYLGEDKGVERLFVIISAEPLQDLEDLYFQYSQADDESDKSELLSRLLAMLENRDGQVFVFKHE